MIDNPNHGSGASPPAERSQVHHVSLLEDCPLAVDQEAGKTLSYTYLEHHISRPVGPGLLRKQGERPGTQG